MGVSDMIVTASISTLYNKVNTCKVVKSLCLTTPALKVNRGYLGYCGFISRVQGCNVAITMDTVYMRAPAISVNRPLQGYSDYAG